MTKPAGDFKVIAFSRKEKTPNLNQTLLWFMCGNILAFFFHNILVCIFGVILCLIRLYQYFIHPRGEI